MKTITAIDPGASGGIAWKHPSASVVAENLPDSDTGILDLLSAIYAQAEIEDSGPPELYIEDVASHAGNIALAASMAKLYGGKRFIEGVAMALGYRIINVRPVEWQKHFSLGKKADHGTKWKSHLKDEAQRRNPGIKVNLKTADALLILEFALSKQ